MKVVLRSILILCSLFILRVLTGCFNNDCPNDMYSFDFKNIKINNLDNSGKWPAVLASDSMHKAAVAFQVFLSSDQPYLGESSNRIQGIGFSDACAWSKTNCPSYYISNQTVESISVVSLFEISESIPANTEVSGLFLGSDETDWYVSELYLTLEKLSKKINHMYIDAQAVQFRLFLGRAVENDSAQFLVNVNFTDHTSLSDTTHLIFIR